MRTRHFLLTSFAAASIGFVAASAADGAEVAKTNPLPVYMHYMPWFDTPEVLGGNNWGFHWRMNNRNPNVVDATGKRQIASHYYPMIGPYQSSNPDVVEYHLLLMKYAGVDGVLIDWYGVEGSNGDIDLLLDNSNALVDKTDDFGIDFAVVLEDRFSQSVAQGQANVAYLRDNYFNRPEYVRLGPDQDPLVGVFGPITFESPSEWAQIIPQAGEPIDLVPLWYQAEEVGSGVGGEFAWVFEDEATDDHLQRLTDFYEDRAPILRNGGRLAGGSAYPGFDDFYEEGGVGDIIPFDIPHDDGQTLDATLDLAETFAGNMDFLQLVTFNDFGEGTIFEPTVETGFEYLKRVQEFTGVSYGEDELQLVYRLYLARQEYGDVPVLDGFLDQVSERLADLDVAGARGLLDLVAPLGDYDGDGDVDLADRDVWEAQFGSETILFGSGADGNYDGRVDAADFTVWRDGFAATATAVAVPEAAAATLAGFVAAAAAAALQRVAPPTSP